MDHTDRTTIDPQEFLKLLKKEQQLVTKYQEKIRASQDQKLLVKHQNKIKELLKNCPHPELEQKSYYFPGSYTDTAYTQRWNQCKICNARSEIITESHGYYG